MSQVTCNPTPCSCVVEDVSTSRRISRTSGDLSPLVKRTVVAMVVAALALIVATALLPEPHPRGALDPDPGHSLTPVDTSGGHDVTVVSG